MAIATTTQPTLTQLLRQRPGLRQLLVIRVADELGAQMPSLAASTWSAW
jgi:hypothetical protein